MQRLAVSLGKAILVLGIIIVAAVLAVMVFAPEEGAVKYRLVKVTEKSENTIFEIKLDKKFNIANKNKVTIVKNPTADGCVIKIGKKRCFTAPFSPEPLSKRECEKFKSDLGITGCYYSKDYWAGAVKKCGGVSNLSSMSDLARIAGAVYKGNPKIEDEQSAENFEYKDGLIKSLGLNDSSFCLWASAENGKLGVSAHGRCFNPTYTHFFVDYFRKFDTVKAICLTKG